MLLNHGLHDMSCIMRYLRQLLCHLLLILNRNFRRQAKARLMNMSEKVCIRRHAPIGQLAQTYCQRIHHRLSCYKIMTWRSGDKHVSPNIGQVTIRQFQCQSLLMSRTHVIAQRRSEQFGRSGCSQ